MKIREKNYNFQITGLQLGKIIKFKIYKYLTQTSKIQSIMIQMWSIKTQKHKAKLKKRRRKLKIILKLVKKIKLA